MRFGDHAEIESDSGCSVHWIHVHLCTTLLLLKPRRFLVDLYSCLFRRKPIDKNSRPFSYQSALTGTIRTGVYCSYQIKNKNIGIPPTCLTVDSSDMLCPTCWARGSFCTVRILSTNVPTVIYTAKCTRFFRALRLWCWWHRKRLSKAKTERRNHRISKKRSSSVAIGLLFAMYQASVVLAAVELLCRAQETEKKRLLGYRLLLWPEHCTSRRSLQETVNGAFSRCWCPVPSYCPREKKGVKSFICCCFLPKVTTKLLINIISV